MSTTSEKPAGRTSAPRLREIQSHRTDQEYAEVGALGVVPLATLGGRLLARLIDGVIVGVPTVVLYTLVGKLAGLPMLLVVAALAVVATGYEVLCTRNGGSTPGKRVARIAVVRADTGAALTGGASVSRALVLLFVPVVPVAGLIFACCCLVSTLRTEDRMRGWHDRIANTVVLAGRS